MLSEINLTQRDYLSIFKDSSESEDNPVAAPIYFYHEMQLNPWNNISIEFQEEDGNPEMSFTVFGKSQEANLNGFISCLNAENKV
jgi:hypothetical protein